MIKIQVPATTANIGPGFDSLGIALSLYNIFYIDEINEGLVFEGVEESFSNEDNLIYKSMRYTFDKVGYEYKGVKIKVDSKVPLSRGLGSSATCIVAGVIGANYIAGNPLNMQGVLEVATEIEGHPDNVAPCIFGGMVSSIMDKDKVIYSKIPIKNDYKFCPIIPNFKLSTKEARQVLPSEVDYKDALYNVSRVSLLISAFVNGEDELIKYGCKDVLHQPYRKSLIKNYEDVVTKCEKENACGVFLSGAGPTIMSIINSNEDYLTNMQNYLKKLDNQWDILELSLDDRGAFIEIV